MQSKYIAFVFIALILLSTNISSGFEDNTGISLKKFENQSFSIGNLDLSLSDISAPNNYGFILSEKQINTKLRNFINDLLRENVPVYWTMENKSVNVKEITINGISSEDYLINFGRGSFIVPFTKNITQDIKIITLVYDYNVSSEIEYETNTDSPIYIISEQITIQTYLLTDVKIAQVENEITPTDIESYYMAIAGFNGFLSFDLVPENQLYTDLKLTNYNLLMWPGGTAEYIEGFKNLLSSSLKKNSSSEAVRIFVSKGGGFVGSCYGAFMASCGSLPLPIYLKRRAYNPNLRSFGFLSISDVLTCPTGKIGMVNLKIINSNHPTTIGLDQNIITYISEGPKITHVGANSEVVAMYNNCDRFINNSPAMIDSSFGDGRVIIFSPHPEMYAYNEGYVDVKDKIMSNTIFYTTYKEKINLQTTDNRNTSFIHNIWEKTMNLLDVIVIEESLFDDIKSEINVSINQLYNLTDYFAEWHITYYNKILKNFEKIEEVYQILKNDNEFIQNLKIFKVDILELINKTKSATVKAINSRESYYTKHIQLNLKYKPLEPFIRLKLLILKPYYNNYIHSLYKHLCYTPAIYFNSIKFLRSNWYNYEFSIAI